MRLGQSISGSWDTLTEGGCVECMLILVHIWNGQSISGPQDTLTRGGLCAVNTLPGILLGWSEYLSEGELCVMYTHHQYCPRTVRVSLELKNYICHSMESLDIPSLTPWSLNTSVV